MPDINDALDRLREEDPAQNLAALSATDRESIRDSIVATDWRRGDTPAGSKQRKRPRITVSRGRALIAIGVVLVGGGVATAAISSQSTTSLIATGLSCLSGENNHAMVGAYDVDQTGVSPTAACAPVIGKPASSLVACVDKHAGIVVYEADRDPDDQCKSLGLQPLPADYVSASKQILALKKAMTADYDSTNCISPKQLAKDTNIDLKRLGFTGWHAVIDHQSYPTGHCGQFPSGALDSDPSAALATSGSGRVLIEIGPSRSIQRVEDRTQVLMVNATERRCYTLAGAEKLVRSILDQAAGRTVQVKFAVMRIPANAVQTDESGSSRPQARYDQGCTIAGGAGTASDGQTFLAPLMNKAAPTASPPPASAYKTELTSG